MGRRREERQEEKQEITKKRPHLCKGCGSFFFEKPSEASKKLVKKSGDFLYGFLMLDARAKEKARQKAWRLFVRLFDFFYLKNKSKADMPACQKWLHFHMTPSHTVYIFNMKRRVHFETRSF